MGEQFASIAGRFPRHAWHLRVVLLLTLVLLGAGLVSPIITLKKFMLVESTFSVLGGVVTLFREGQFFLFVLIGAFSIVLPVLKIAVLFSLLGMNVRSRFKLDTYLHWMHLYGKWSMLDVFVVAVLVVAVKLGAIASVEMRYGLYLFAAAVILTMVVTARVVVLAERTRAEPV